MERKYWLRVCARACDNREQLLQTNMDYAQWMIDNAIEHGFFVEPIMNKSSEIVASMIVSAMIRGGLIKRLNSYSFYREWVRERQEMKAQIKSCNAFDIGYGFSKSYPVSWPYTHFVTREIDASKYVERCYEMISPDWEEEHETAGNIYLYLSNRMEKLEEHRNYEKVDCRDISIDDVGLIKNVAGKMFNKSDITSFEELVVQIRAKKKCDYSTAILDTIYDIYEQYFEQ